MAEVTAAIAAANLSTYHAVTRVSVHGHRLRGDLPVKARPAAARIKLAVGGEEVVAAGPTFVDTLVEVHVVRTGEGPFRAFLPKDTVFFLG